MTDDDNALVYKLRHTGYLNIDNGDWGLVNPDGPEAADRIEALIAENERLREVLLQMKRMPNYIRKDDNRKEMLKIINAALGETK